MQQQLVLLEEAKKNCTLEIENQSKKLINWCPQVWDSILCWPQTKPGHVKVLPCPLYIFGFNYEANASKKCMDDGKWYVHSEQNNSWTNYTQCLQNTDIKYYLAEHLSNYYLITVIGYTLSLIALLAAFFIFSFNKRLHSPKNNLHMKLFMSFILRCVLFHIKRFIAYSDDLPDLNTSSNSNDLILGTGMPLACKIFTIIWQFTLLANYNWILMEAVYLHSLISFNTFNDNSSITKYTIFGWSIPAIMMIPWSLAKYFYENNECWTTINNTYIFWIIKGPITLSIILSFMIFLNVIRILYLKIFSSRAPPNQINGKYTKWFRSTLVLVPLFGVHHTLLLICKILTFNKKVEVILFYFDLIFTSFQGFFVALLYCFFSSEVLLELRKSWSRFLIRKNNRSLRHCPSDITSGYFNSVLNQSIKSGNRKKNSLNEKDVKKNVENENFVNKKPIEETNINLISKIEQINE